MKGLATLLLAAATGAAGAGLTAHLAPPVRTSGALPHEAYVWQRSWTADVGAAVRGRRAAFRGLVVLGAEISWSPVSVAWVDPDWAALAARDPSAGARPVGLALRIGGHAGPFDADHAASRLVRDTARELIRRARAAGVEPSELQLDFDCAESRLDGYREWVRQVRAVASEDPARAAVPVTITALPAWLDRWAFGRLVRETDGYVLQVHLFSPPRGPGRVPPLCDPARARRWVDDAARAGVPFRVALPTYGYLLAFGPRGDLLGLSAESEPRAWPADTVVRDVRADAPAMADLVRGWGADRPESLEGVIWYRLPVEGDELNWSFRTLERVMAGGEPRPDLRVELRRPEPALVEIDLVNAGEAEARAGVSVELRWDDARLLAADALHGFALERGGQAGDAGRGGLARLAGVAEARTETLPPGGRRLVGWLRFEEATDVEVRLVR